MSFNVLIGCEESQVECLAFRRYGANAFSCDIKSCSGGFPQYHILGDVFSVLPDNNLNITFRTEDGREHYVNHWDMAIFHPPCQFLSFVGNKYFSIEKYGDKALERIANRELAAEFFMKLYNCNIDKICVENPNGYMTQFFRKPDQIIQPYYFDEYFSKRTCYWLKNLPPLMYTCFNSFYSDTWLYEYNKSKCCRSKAEYRSKSFPKVADAMAFQWLPEKLLMKGGFL